jgi:hypothetical protein
MSQETSVEMMRVPTRGRGRQRGASLGVIEVRGASPGLATQHDRPPDLSANVLTLDFAMHARERRDERIVEGEVGRGNGTEDDEILTRRHRVTIERTEGLEGQQGCLRLRQVRRPLRGRSSQ